MKKIPNNFLNELISIMHMDCEIECEECIFNEHSSDLCEKLSVTVGRMNKIKKNKENEK